MKTDQMVWNVESGWHGRPPSSATIIPQLVLAFGSPATLMDRTALSDMVRAFPQATIFGCSTSGEIHGTRVVDESLVATAIEFASTTIHTGHVEILDAAHSFEAGRSLAAAVPSDGLRHAFVLTDGLTVNGSELVRGLGEVLPERVSITGGLSGDGARFHRTLVLWKGLPQTGIATIVGFYGSDLQVGYGSLGGWDPFGPERLITRSLGNVLYELDGQSALGLYKRYLGEHAAGLPATGLLFPLSLRTTEGSAGVVRTILAVDEEAQSMTFAGDVPEGAFARLMKANFDRLVEGAVGAAHSSRNASAAAPELAVLISCVGRKLILGQRIEEEVEGVREVLGQAATFAGFYSYGEISPFTKSGRCELHNQTMTITTFAEV